MTQNKITNTTTLQQKEQHNIITSLFLGAQWAKNYFSFDLHSPPEAALSGCELVLVLQRPALGLGAPEPAELRRRRLRTSHRAGDFGANRDTGG